MPNRFHGKAVVEGQRKFLGTLWNTYAFFVLYANIDQFDATKYTLDYPSLTVMDKWVLSRLNTMVKTVDENLGQYKIPEAARALQDFVDDLSNWYVRTNRERFWGKGMEQDKINAYLTLYTALVTTAKAAAPMIPFMAEDIYRNLVCSIDEKAPVSVHLCDFPQGKEEWSDPALEENMAQVLQVVTLGRAARNTASIKNRQPLSRMYVKSEQRLEDFFCKIIEEELNVKEVIFTNDESGFTTYRFKPQLRTLGPRYGKQLGEISRALAEVDGNKAKKELDETGALVLTVSTGEIKLAPEDVLMETAQKEGFATAGEAGISVALDTSITEELREEGFVREVVSKLQTMRKEAGFEVTDHITVYVAGNENLETLVGRNQPSIAPDVLAENVVYGQTGGYAKEWDINGEPVTLGVEKI